MGIKKRISIHAGQSPNGKPNSGNTNSFTGLRECDVNLSIGKKIKYQLEKSGIEVPEVIQSSSIISVVNSINTNGSDFFISLNCNSKNMQLQGTEVHILTQNSEIAPLATLILTNIVNTVGTENRGIKIRPDNYILKNTKPYGISIELAFIDNKEDEKLLREKQDLFVTAISQAIITYFRE